MAAKDPWIILPTEGVAIEIAPGQTKTLVVSGIAEAPAGERRGTVVATWDSGTSEMPVKASVRMERRRAARLYNPPPEIPQTRTRQDEEDKPALGINRDELARMVARDRLKVISAETFPGRVHLKWLDPSPEPRTYRIEFRPSQAGWFRQPTGRCSSERNRLPNNFLFRARVRVPRSKASTEGGWYPYGGNFQKLRSSRSLPKPRKPFSPGLG